MKLYGHWVLVNRGTLGLSYRRIWSADDLPLLRAFMAGPKWRRHFDVREVRAGDYPKRYRYHHPRRKFLEFTFEADVRERVLEPLRPGVVAEWSDPREHLPRAPPSPRSR